MAHKSARFILWLLSNIVLFSSPAFADQVTNSAQVVESSGPLISPINAAKIQSVWARDTPQFQCIPVFTPVISIKSPSFYTGGNASTQTQERAQEYQAATRDIYQFVRQLAIYSDYWLLSGRQDIAQCAVNWLATWARADALKGPHTEQGNYDLNFKLFSLSIIWMKLQGAQTTPSDSLLISGWLNQLSDRNVAYYSRLNWPTRNNHYAFVGASQLVLSITGNDKSRFSNGIDLIREQLRSIRSDGTISAEMERESKALWYHSFSLRALSVGARVAGANGIDLYSEFDGALRRLVIRTSEGFLDPTFFTSKTGHRQYTPWNNDISVPNFEDVAWLPIVFDNVNDESFRRLFRRHPAMFSPEMGGGMRLTFGRPMMP